MSALGDIFAIVPIEAISDRELTPSEFKVLVALYSFRDKNADTTFPKLDALAARAGFKDPTQVSKLTTRLEAKGWLTKRQKMGFHGPKKYRLSIPDRLLPVGQVSQLGRNAQVGESDPVNSSNLEETTNLENSPNTNLDKTTNSQLGQNYQDYKNIPVRTDQLTDSVPDGTAADRGTPVDNSMIALGKDYRSQSAKQLIFDRGVNFLVDRGVTDKHARSFLGKCMKDSSAGRTMDAIITAILSQPEGDPKAYILQVLANPDSPMDANWEPDTSAVAELQALGVPTNLIRESRDRFVLWFKHMEIYHNDWPMLFRRWVVREWESSDFDAFRYKRRLAESFGPGSTETFREPA